MADTAIADTAQLVNDTVEEYFKRAARRNRKAHTVVTVTQGEAGLVTQGEEGLVTQGEAGLVTQGEEGRERRGW